MDDMRAICATRAVFLRGEALAAGYDDRMLARAVRDRLLVRVRHGAYVFADEWDLLDDSGRHLKAAAAVLRTGATELVLSHVTAAVAHGIPLWAVDLGEVHVTRVDMRAGRREAGVVQHRSTLVTDDVVAVCGVPATSPARTAFDLSTIVGTEQALCAVNALLHVRATSVEEIRNVTERGQRVPGSVRTDLVLRLATGGCESIGESRCLYMFFRGGLPRPSVQHVVRGPGGEVLGRVDFAWPEHGVFVEFDGRVKYEALLRSGESASDVVVREKRREDAIRMFTGWICIRLTWQDLQDPVHTCAVIARALARRTAA